MKINNQKITSVIKKISRAIFYFSESNNEEVPFGWYSKPEISAYFDAAVKQKTYDPDEIMDDFTYEDIGAVKYSEYLLKNSSVFARQYFEFKIRFGSSQPESENFIDEAYTISDRVSYFKDLKMCLKPLLQVRQEIASVIFSKNKINAPTIFFKIRYASSFGVLFCLLFAFYFNLITLSLLISYAIFSFYVQIRCYKFLKEWTGKRNSLQKLLGVALSCMKLNSNLTIASSNQIVSDDKINEILDGLSPGFLASSLISEYANLFFLYEYTRVNKEISIVEKYKNELQAIYDSIAKKELQLAISEMVMSGVNVCRPEKSISNNILFRNLKHPLLSASCPIDVHTENKSIFVSGKNGVGKSTLLRAIGISIATYKAFGYSHADKATLPQAMIWSSIQVNDSIEQGRSLYMTELMRASRLIEISKYKSSKVFLIDELFHGTNYQESVAASAAVLHELAKRNTVFVTSHNSVLAALLHDRFRAYKLVKTKFDELKLVPGVLVNTNGIDLMTSYDFDFNLIENARRIAEWYSEYVSNPESIPDKLFGK